MTSHATPCVAATIYCSFFNTRAALDLQTFLPQSQTPSSSFAAIFCSPFDSVPFHPAMARLFRRSDAQTTHPSHRAPSIDISPTNQWDSYAREPYVQTDTALHSPSSWQRAQKLQSLPSSQRRGPSHAALAAATAYELHSESSRAKTPLVPCEAPATPNAAVRMQRALTPKIPAIPSGNVRLAATGTHSRPSSAAGSSLPPHDVSSRSAPSVEYFAASEATALRRRADGTRHKQRQGSATPVAGKERQHTAAPRSNPVKSDDPVVQLAASIYDSSHSMSSSPSAAAATSSALGALHQELGKLQAHRVLELERLKAATQRPPANLLMRERNLPESEASEGGKLELSLRNRCGLCARRFNRRCAPVCVMWSSLAFVVYAAVALRLVPLHLMITFLSAALTSTGKATGPSTQTNR
jgi:hypothetical protein